MSHSRFFLTIKVAPTGIMLESLELNQLILKTPAQVDA